MIHPFQIVNLKLNLIQVKPCFFFKLNKIYNFNPEPIMAADLDQPEYEDMSAQLKVGEVVPKVLYIIQHRAHHGCRP